MYFSGSAAETSGEIREGLNRGPLVEADEFALPVAAAGEDHISVNFKIEGMSSKH